MRKALPSWSWSVSGRLRLLLATNPLATPQKMDTCAQALASSRVCSDLQLFHVRPALAFICAVGFLGLVRPTADVIFVQAKAHQKLTLLA